MEHTLQYAVPKKLWAVLQGRSYKHALDLGCGTGLSGMAIRPVVAQLTGVDIAAKMLAVAREKGIYDDLVEAELLSFLTQNITTFDLLVAADVLPYFGDLAPIFQSVIPRMAAEAVFWFTTEISMDAPWALQESMRFCHHPEYVRSVCAQHGLMIQYQETMTARKQDDRDLLVILYGVGCAHL